MQNTKNTLRGYLKLKNGDAHAFVDHIHYGDELWFLYREKKYFLEGWSNNNHLELCLYEMSDTGKKYIWEGTPTRYPVDAFLHAPLFDGRTFWEAEQDITWIDD